MIKVNLPTIFEEEMADLKFYNRKKDLESL